MGGRRGGKGKEGRRGGVMTKLLPMTCLCYNSPWPAASHNHQGRPEMQDQFPETEDTGSALLSE